MRTFADQGHICCDCATESMSIMLICCSASDTLIRAAAEEKLSGMSHYTASLEKSLRSAQKIIKERDTVRSPL